MGKSRTEMPIFLLSGEDLHVTAGENFVSNTSFWDLIADTAQFDSNVDIEFGDRYSSYVWIW